MTKKIMLSFFGCLCVSFLGVQFWQYRYQTQSVDFATSTQAPTPLTKDDYHQNVQTIFDSKCVSCHSCYNSPCQLDLTSFEAVMRGANKSDVYSPGLMARNPTRMYRDAFTTEQWRDLKFYPVISVAHDGRPLPEASPLYRLLELRQNNPNVRFEYQAEESRSCPNLNLGYSADDRRRSKNDNPERELTIFMRENPHAGMPYGFPPLKTTESDLIKKWIEDEFPGPSPAATAYTHEPTGADVSIAEIKNWEDYFNATDLKSQLISRYIYEHLFLAHIYFKNEPTEFFRLVRAKNQTGKVDEMPTRRPYDRPTGPFYYRLTKVYSTIAHKNHIPYKFSPERRTHWTELFRDTVAPPAMPPYDEAGANPFVTFQNIPAKSRYQFLLDDSYYHVMTFIKGPVCRGNTALNVIDDNFWVMFVDPERDITVNDPAFFKQAAVNLAPPAAEGNWISNKDLENYAHIRDKFLSVTDLKYRMYDEAGVPRDENFVWDGGQNSNPNALLTVLRHTDSALVMRGAHGVMPKTLWILDYPIFEDIYYNLVAGFDVYGSALHQFRTRMHMDISRVSSQDLFLTMLPKEVRVPARDLWTTDSPEKNSDKLLAFLESFRNLTAFRRMKVTYVFKGKNVPSNLDVNSQDPKIAKEEVLKILFSGRLAKVFPKRDLLNARALEVSMNGAVDTPEEVEATLQNIVDIPSASWSDLPDVSMLKVNLPNGRSSFYTMVLNRDHYNVSFMITEGHNLNPAGNSLSILPGFASSYPNFYFEFPSSATPDFVKYLSDLRAAGTGDAQAKALQALVNKFGITRYYSEPSKDGDHKKDKDFWTYHKEFTEAFKALDKIEGGVLDLNRYMNFAKDTVRE